MRGLTFAAALLFGLAEATGAFAHASLLRSEPADGAILEQPPPTLRLTFNEPVAPLVLRLIAPGGEMIAPTVAAKNAVVTVSLPALGRGTHNLSWRVISADGHPVGGALSFSVGAPSAPPPVSANSNPDVAVALWFAKLLIYAGLLIGIGSTFFRAWLDGSEPAPANGVVARVLLWPLIAGLSATVLSVGLQGLDALAMPLSGYLQGDAWRTGLETAYGLTAITAAIAILLAIIGEKVRQRTLRRVFATSALIGAGLALSLSGHAGTVEPRILTRAAIFAHAVCVGFWVGAFIPLLAGSGPAGKHALRQFTLLIPYALAVLIVAGSTLAWVQLDRLDALWTTQYGIVLSAKLAAVAALLALGAANRFVLVPRYEANMAPAARHPLARSIGSELVLALAIFALIALWRFTPPPRALAAAEHVSAHFHGDRAMTQIEMEPKRGRGLDVDVQVLDHEMRPLQAQELTLVLVDPAGRIEPIRRRASDSGDGIWHIENLTVPIAGIWRLRIDVLINDFEKETVEDRVELPRAP
jgi:copper transport protein